MILTLGNNALPKAVAPLKIWVNLYSFWIARIKGVNASGKNPLKASLSAIKTLDIPLALLTLCATASHLLPATKTVISPPIFFAALKVLQVIGNSDSLLCSAITNVDS